ncbi:DUF6879 family protein [Nocardia amamiensis]|uniref:DUF6879 family protein n=1 Tax=Nocardia amamiensis TaxID=404578 RepID=UPI0033CB77CD
MRLLLGGDAFGPVFDSARHRLFHLETRDDYSAENETAALTRWKADETADPRAASFPAWAATVSGIVGRGVVVQRARIVTEPHSAYTRYLLALARYNTDAGESIRYLPRHRAEPSDSEAEDFWLVDDDAAAYSLFDDRGFWVGAALTHDPAIVGPAVAIRDRVWAAATPFEEYAGR